MGSKFLSSTDIKDEDNFIVEDGEDEEEEEEDENDENDNEDDDFDAESCGSDGGEIRSKSRRKER